MFTYGRLESKDLTHLEKYAYDRLYGNPVFTVERELRLPDWHKEHDQGSDSACTGFGSSMAISIVNDEQCRKQGIIDPICRYNPWWIWNEAKKNDDYENTAPGDNNGTTVKAAMKVLRDIGVVIWDGKNKELARDYTKDFFDLLHPEAGISNTRWATSIDEIRTAIYNGIPVTIGTNWYRNFESPEEINGEFWIGKRSYLGPNRGGHCYCFYGASDLREAFKIKNSWSDYPEVYIPYEVVERLLKENGEAALITDR